jgi:hypothetical protein
VSLPVVQQLAELRSQPQGASAGAVAMAVAAVAAVGAVQQSVAHPHEGSAAVVTASAAAA